MTKKIKIPIKLLRWKKDSGTVAIRGAGGRFKGRRGPDSSPSYVGRGDTTRARHLYKSVDWNKDGKINANEKGGVIFGRTQRIKATRRARGYERRV